MSKTAEQVVSEAIESHWKTALNMHGPICASGTSFGVVSALRSAGWLREHPVVDGYMLRPCDKCATLERDLAAARASQFSATERQSALDTITQLRKELAESLNAFENQGRLVTTLLAKATPDAKVQRVVEAARAERNRLREWQNKGDQYVGAPAELIAAVDALGAPEKVVGPPYVVRYRRPDTFPWMVCIRNGDAQSLWRTEDAANAECARLNAEAR